MKKPVNPIALVVGGIVLVALLVFMYMRFMAPQKEPYVELPASTDDERATKRANHEKRLNGQATGTTAPTAGTDTRQ